MAPKQPIPKPSLQSTASAPAPSSSSSPTGISVFFRKLEKPVAEIQKFLIEYPRYEEQFLDHENINARQKELISELEQKDKRMKELEEAISVFEGVHMMNSMALKDENSKLGDRLTEARVKITEVEKSAKASQNDSAAKYERMIKDKRQELDKAAQDQMAALDKQKIRFEKQHSETIEKHNLQLNKVVSDMKKQGLEIDKLELINDGLKDRASKLKELQQAFSNIPDDVL